MKTAVYLFRIEAITPQKARFHLVTNLPELGKRAYFYLVTNLPELGKSHHCFCFKRRKLPDMYGGDAQGDDGMKGLNACVKVMVVGRPEVKEYERSAALELLLSCYAGCVPKGLYEFDPLTLFDVRSGYSGCKRYNIREIYEALNNFDGVTYVQKCPQEGPGSDELRCLIDKRRTDVERELEEAKADPDGRRQYPWLVAQRRVRDCFAGNFAGDGPILERKLNPDEPYSIDEIYETVGRIEENGQLFKYDLSEGPGSDELNDLIDENWSNLNKEYKEAAESDFVVAHEYSWSEAEQRVRSCFAGTLEDDTDIFATRKKTYDIFEIQRAIDNFDVKKLMDKYPKQGPEYEEKKQQIDAQRVRIKTEYEDAIKWVDIEYGSGFIIHDHSIITSKHVIQEYLVGAQKCEIYISNAVINNLPCKVAHHDAAKDLALLYCPDLNLEGCEICPLQLSSQPLLAGMSISCLDYPIHYKGKRALFVDGKVSGSKETFFGLPLVMLNCSLSSGNSGSPVLRMINGSLKVVGVVTRQDIQEILTEDQITAMINDSKDDSSEVAQISVQQLSLKLHDALMGIHSPYNFIDALPGHLVVEFVDDTKNYLQ